MASAPLASNDPAPPPGEEAEESGGKEEEEAPPLPAAHPPHAPEHGDGSTLLSTALPSSPQASPLPWSGSGSAEDTGAAEPGTAEPEKPSYTLLAKLAPAGSELGSGASLGGGGLPGGSPFLTGHARPAAAAEAGGREWLAPAGVPLYGEDPADGEDPRAALTAAARSRQRPREAFDHPSGAFDQLEAPGALSPPVQVTRNPKPETRNPKPETRNMKPESGNLTPETRKAYLDSLARESVGEAALPGGWVESSLWGREGVALDPDHEITL